jgi:Cdc6-like AAA superfamily ATPase
VLVIDEIDYLCAGKYQVLYTLFNWTRLASAKFVIISIANTMDLAERVLPQKVQRRFQCSLLKVGSRMGVGGKVQFHAYSKDQLVKILEARLGSSASLFHPQALMYIAGRVCRPDLTFLVQTKQVIGVE